MNQCSRCGDISPSSNAFCVYCGNQLRTDVSLAVIAQPPYGLSVQSAVTPTVVKVKERPNALIYIITGGMAVVVVAVVAVLVVVLLSNKTPSTNNKTLQAASSVTSAMAVSPTVDQQQTAIAANNSTATAEAQAVQDAQNNGTKTAIAMQAQANQGTATALAASGQALASQQTAIVQNQANTATAIANATAAAQTATANQQATVQAQATATAMAAQAQANQATAAAQTAQAQAQQVSHSDYLAFAQPDSAGSNGHWDIYTMKIDGSNLKRITSNTNNGDYISPVWSPDGQWIAYVDDVSDSGAGTRQIHKMRPDGSGDVNLTPENNIDNQYPFWSPDDNQIYFISNREPNSNGTSGASVYSMNPDGNNVTKVVADAGVISRVHNDLTFIRFNGKTHDLYFSTSGQTTKLAGGDTDYDFAVVSPNGQWIATTRGYTNGSIELINLSNGQMRQISGNGEWATDASWSPDSTSVAYIVNDNNGHGHQINIVNIQTGAIQTVYTSNTKVFYVSWGR